MSFDLAIWFQGEPVTGDEAYSIYDRLTDGAVGVVESSPAISTFLADLVEIYPKDEDGTGSSPWASDIYSNAECVLLAISWSRKDEVARRVGELTSRNGLAVYDPQSRRFLR